MSSLSMGRRVVAIVAVTALLTASGCHVDTEKRGEKDNVNISTPFGGVHVRTNDDAVLENIGLAAYPGAVLAPKRNNKGDDSADIDMHFGSFQLRVKAANYHSDDSLDKVESFYRKDLSRYGDVIACRGHSTLGEPAKTLSGLTCEDNSRRRITVDDAAGKDQVQLKAGSRSHQHIVTLEPERGGTRFGLIMLDLPSDPRDKDKEAHDID